MISLSVNVDHVATLRQARLAGYPDPIEAAHIAEEAGAEGITVHLRGDRRHIQEDDLARLISSVRGKVNLEIAATEEMLGIARELRPHQVTLVPERPEEVTTEGGLDLLRHGARIESAARSLKAAGIRVSLFLDPAPEQLLPLAEIGSQWIEGFEINTDAYCKAWSGDPSPALETIRVTATEGRELGFRVFAGHGLTTANVVPVAGLGLIEEMNIGHWLVARAVMVGLREAVREMLRAMAVPTTP